MMQRKLTKNRYSTTRTGHGAASWVFLVMISTVMVFALIAFFSRVNVTIPFNITWIFIFVTSLSLLLGSMAMLLRRNGTGINIRGGIVKKCGVVLAGLFGFAILVEFSVFLGIPKALHYLSSEERQIKVSIAGKENRHQGRRSIINRCRYRVYIKEFTNFPSNHLCVEKEFYSKINEEDFLLLAGNASSFGIAVNRIKLIPRDHSYERRTDLD